MTDMWVQESQPLTLRQGNSVMLFTLQGSAPIRVRQDSRAVTSSVLSFSLSRILPWFSGSSQEHFFIEKNHHPQLWLQGALSHPALLELFAEKHTCKHTNWKINLNVQSQMQMYQKLPVHKDKEAWQNPCSSSSRWYLGESKIKSTQNSSTLRHML